jgi:hypothetical protein
MLRPSCDQRGENSIFLGNPKNEPTRPHLREPPFAKVLGDEGPGERAFIRESSGRNPLSESLPRETSWCKEVSPRTLPKTLSILPACSNVVHESSLRQLINISKVLGGGASPKSYMTVRTLVLVGSWRRFASQIAAPEKKRT